MVIDAETNEILARVGRPEESGAIRYTAKGVWTSAHDVESINWWTPASMSGAGGGESEAQDSAEGSSEGIATDDASTRTDAETEAE